MKQRFRGEFCVLLLKRLFGVNNPARTKNIQFMNIKNKYLLASIITVIFRLEFFK